MNCKICLALFLDASVIHRKSTGNETLRSFLLNCVREIHKKHSSHSAQTEEEQENEEQGAEDNPDIGARARAQIPAGNAQEYAPLNFGNTPKVDPMSRLSGKISQHKLVMLRPTVKKQRPTRVCRVCSRNKLRSESRYKCLQCKMPLHKGTGYTKYHSLRKYWN